MMIDNLKKKTPSNICSNDLVALQSPCGEYLLAEEQKLFDNMVVDIFGFNAVQIGWPSVNLLAQSRMPMVLKINATQGDVVCDSNALPFQANCVDLVLLPHTLENSENPHQTLREVERILVPEGCLILTGISPLSTWGMRFFLINSLSKFWMSFKNKSIKTYQDDVNFDLMQSPKHIFSKSRISDWLVLLDLEIVSCERACYTLPINKASWLSRQAFMDNFGKRFWSILGGIYCIKAKKRVVGMTLIKPDWKNQKKLAVKQRLVATSIQKNNLK